jgi:hypothetical protein
MDIGPVPLTANVPAVSGILIVLSVPAGLKTREVCCIFKVAPAFKLIFPEAIELAVNPPVETAPVVVKSPAAREIAPEVTLKPPETFRPEPNTLRPSATFRPEEVILPPPLVDNPPVDIVPAVVMELAVKPPVETVPAVVMELAVNPPVETVSTREIPPEVTLKPPETFSPPD